MRIRSLALTLLVPASLNLLSLAPAAHAQDIVYTYLTTLSVAGGSDPMHLNNATVDITFSVPVGATYFDYDRSGLPAVFVTNPQLTISGSGLAANNGTFALPPSAFIQSSAFLLSTTHLFTESNGSYPTIVLSGDSTLVFADDTYPTSAGTGVHVGDTVNVAQFGPATSFDDVLEVTSSTNATDYFQNGTTINASVTSTPEPGSVALLVGMGLSGAGFLARRRKNARKAA